MVEKGFYGKKEKEREREYVAFVLVEERERERESREENFLFSSLDHHQEQECSHAWRRAPNARTPPPAY